MVFRYQDVYCYHDEEAESLAKIYPPNNFNGITRLTGDAQEEALLQPFLVVARHTGKFYGFDVKGYEKLTEKLKIEYFYHRPLEEELIKLVLGTHESRHKWLRPVDLYMASNGKYVQAYFINELLAKCASSEIVKKNNNPKSLDILIQSST